jgi:hypothetical protein
MSGSSQISKTSGTWSTSMCQYRYVTDRTNDNTTQVCSSPHNNTCLPASHSLDSGQRRRPR